MDCVRIQKNCKTFKIVKTPDSATLLTVSPSVSDVLLGLLKKESKNPRKCVPEAVNNQPDSFINKCRLTLAEVESAFMGCFN